MFKCRNSHENYSRPIATLTFATEKQLNAELHLINIQASLFDHLRGSGLEELVSVLVSGKIVMITALVMLPIYTTKIPFRYRTVQ